MNETAEQQLTDTCPICQTPTKVKADGTLFKHGRPLPCTGSGTPVGTARIPRRSKAGFYKCWTTGAMLRSVTTIISEGCPKPALIYWAGNLVAETAFEYLPKLVRAVLYPAARQEVYDWLRRAHTRKKDARAEFGTALHAAVEAHILGEPMPVSDDPEIAACLRHFIRFVAEWEVTFEASEMVVANYDDEYAGTLDYLFRTPHLHDNALLAGDTKTGGELDVKGVYPEAGVQMSAYRKAQYGWLRDGTRVPLEMPHDVGYVLHIRPGGYRLIPVRCGDEVYEAFLHMRHVADFQTGAAKNVVGLALTPPNLTTRKAA